MSLCTRCGKEIEGTVETYTGIVDRQPDLFGVAHFYCYYPDGPERKLPLPRWAWNHVKAHDPIRAGYLEPTDHFTMKQKEKEHEVSLPKTSLRP